MSLWQASSAFYVHIEVCLTSWFCPTSWNISCIIKP